MEIRFKTKEHYDTAYTYLHGNNYMFNSYVDELAIRFFHYLPFLDGLNGILEHGLKKDVEYTVHETENRLPALGNAWSAAGDYWMMELTSFSSAGLYATKKAPDRSACI